MNNIKNNNRVHSSIIVQWAIILHPPHVQRVNVNSLSIQLNLFIPKHPWQRCIFWELAYFLVVFLVHK